MNKKNIFIYLLLLIACPSFAFDVTINNNTNQTIRIYVDPVDVGKCSAEWQTVKSNSSLTLCSGMKGSTDTWMGFCVASPENDKKCVGQGHIALPTKLGRQLDVKGCMLDQYSGLRFRCDFNLHN